jgi:hypothetical protein
MVKKHRVLHLLAKLITIFGSKKSRSGQRSSVENEQRSRDRCSSRAETYKLERIFDNFLFFIKELFTKLLEGIFFCLFY